MRSRSSTSFVAYSPRGMSAVETAIAAKAATRLVAAQRSTVMSAPPRATLTQHARGRVDVRFWRFPAFWTGCRLRPVLGSNRPSGHTSVDQVGVPRSIKIINGFHLMLAHRCMSHQRHMAS
jgi:hypothetical protein